MVERSLSVREAPGSIPGLSTFFFSLFKFWAYSMNTRCSILGTRNYFIIQVVSLSRTTKPSRPKSDPVSQMSPFPWSDCKSDHTSLRAAQPGFRTKVLSDLNLDHGNI